MENSAGFFPAEGEQKTYWVPSGIRYSRGAKIGLFRKEIHLFAVKARGGKAVDYPIKRRPNFAQSGPFSKEEGGGF